MKNDRQSMILQVIEEETVETQEQLMQLLAQRGFACTQATVSRDIKQLHLLKVPDGRGNYRYAVSEQKTRLNFEEKLRTIFRECVLTVENAERYGQRGGLCIGQHGGHRHRGDAGRRRYGAAGVPRQQSRGGFL